jgi:hypothetical protein
MAKGQMVILRRSNLRRSAMTTPLSITSRSQGQIFGKEPSMEDFERLLADDPAFVAYGKVCTFLGRLLTLAKSLIQRMQAAKDVAAPRPNATRANAK